jgi:hypothetical protein
MCKVSFCNSRTRGTLSSEKQKDMGELFEWKTYTVESAARTTLLNTGEIRNFGNR